MAGLTLDVVASIAETYAQAAQDALTEAGRPANRVVPMAPGVSPAWDDSCSQLYGRFVQAQPIQSGGQVGNAACGFPFYAVTLGLAVTRCVATPAEKGKRIVLPAAEQVGADGLVMLGDLAVLETVIRCDKRTRSIVSGNSLPEMGGLAGVEWIYTVRVSVCGCPEPTEG